MCVCGGGGGGGGAKIPTALKLSVGVFVPLINPYWLNEATTAIKILQSLGNNPYAFNSCAKFQNECLKTLRGVDYTILLPLNET